MVVGQMACMRYCIFCRLEGSHVEECKLFAIIVLVEAQLENYKDQAKNLVDKLNHSMFIPEARTIPL